MVKSLGIPPKEFTFEYHDKDKNYHLINETPTSFYEKYVKNTLEDMITIISDPREKYPYNRLLHSNYVKNMYEGTGINKLNVSIANEGHQLRIIYPQLTTDKRKELVKQLSVITEQAKVGIRQARQEINKQIKNDEDLSEDLQKHYLEIIQKEIDKSIEKIQNIDQEKQNDLMTI